MDFKPAGAPASSHRTDAFVLFRGKARSDLKNLRLSADPALARAAASAVKAGEFKGTSGETLLLHGGRDGRRLVLAGLGEGESAETCRRAAAAAARHLDQLGLKRATFLAPGEGQSAGPITEGAGLALYRFEQLKSKKRKVNLTHAVVGLEKGRATAALRRSVAEGAAIVDAVSFARDLGNFPGNIATPVYLARRARELSGQKVTVRTHNRADIRRMRMGAFSAVAQASKNEPRLIEFRYRGGGARAKTVALVGKGVTFDTGGISIKPTSGMEDMKFDMCGAGAVFGLMHLVRALQPKLNLHALVPATDNMPGGAAYRPADIVKARNGKTIEVISTDAEGRLLLCDALSYAAEKKPRCIIDLATLTGAVVVALGDGACGLFGNNEDLVGELEAAGQRSGELAWPLPLLPRYSEMMRGTYADLKNAGGRKAGACTAAAFLSEFVGEVPWAHLDIAGVAWSAKDAAYHRRGATGYGVRLLWEFLSS
ncbi:MAG: leucyl aminopeptidase [Planctomycetota bacterium]|jgi:leucyl aminopeptidase